MPLPDRCRRRIDFCSGGNDGISQPHSLNDEPVDHHGETLTAVGQVAIPGAVPPPILVAALGPAMRRVAAELADGTVTWMTGPRTLATSADRARWWPVS